MNKCCITGHRPQRLKKYMDYGNLNDSRYMDYIDSLFWAIDSAVRQGYDYFIVGGALGVDLDSAELILVLKERLNKKIILEIAVPCKNQTLMWAEEDRVKYDRVLKRADVVTVLQDEYVSGCMQKRNEYMIKSSNKVFAVWDKTEKGGTWNAISYAKKLGLNVEILDIL